MRHWFLTHSPGFAAAGVFVGGLAWAVGSSAGVFLLAGVVTFTVALGVSYLLTSGSTPTGRVSSRLVVSPTVQGFVDRAQAAIRELQEMAQSADPFLRAELEPVALSALETFTSMESLAQQVARLEAALVRIDMPSVAAQAQDVQSQMKGAPLEVVRELSLSMASLEQQSEAASRINKAHKQTKVRMQGAAISLEGLVVSAAELSTLGNSSSSEERVRSVISGLDERLTGLRTGLTEMESLSRGALEAA